jgi:hypothetical protein
VIVFTLGVGTTGCFDLLENLECRLKAGEVSDDDGARFIGDSPPDVSCSTNQSWLGGGAESALMMPGVDCISCHRQQDGPEFQVSGTVYPTLNDEDNCIGIEGVVVRLEGSDGTVIELQTNASGNFFLFDCDDQPRLVPPYKASVRMGEVEREMQTQQSDTNCASCHTAAGAGDAPGRIVMDTSTP